MFFLDKLSGKWAEMTHYLSQPWKNLTYVFAPEKFQTGLLLQNFKMLFTAVFQEKASPRWHSRIIWSYKRIPWIDNIIDFPWSNMMFKYCDFSSVQPHPFTTDRFDQGAIKYYIGAFFKTNYCIWTVVSIFDIMQCQCASLPCTPHPSIDKMGSWAQRLVRFRDLNFCLVPKFLNIFR